MATWPPGAMYPWGPFPPVPSSTAPCPLMAPPSAPAAGGPIPPYSALTAGDPKRRVRGPDGQPREPKKKKGGKVGGNRGGRTSEASTSAERTPAAGSRPQATGTMMHPRGAPVVPIPMAPTSTAAATARQIAPYSALTAKDPKRGKRGPDGKLRGDNGEVKVAAVPVPPYGMVPPPLPLPRPLPGVVPIVMVPVPVVMPMTAVMPPVHSVPPNPALPTPSGAPMCSGPSLLMPNKIAADLAAAAPPKGIAAEDAKRKYNNSRSGVAPVPRYVPPWTATPAEIARVTKEAEAAARKRPRLEARERARRERQEKERERAEEEARLVREREAEEGRLAPIRAAEAVLKNFWEGRRERAVRVTDTEAAISVGNNDAADADVNKDAGAIKDDGRDEDEAESSDATRAANDLAKIEHGLEKQLAQENAELVEAAKQTARADNAAAKREEAVAASKQASTNLMHWRARYGRYLELRSEEAEARANLGTLAWNPAPYSALTVGDPKRRVRGPDGQLRNPKKRRGVKAAAAEHSKDTRGPNGQLRNQKQEAVSDGVARRGDIANVTDGDNAVSHAAAAGEDTRSEDNTKSGACDDREEEEKKDEETERLASIAVSDASRERDRAASALRDARVTLEIARKVAEKAARDEEAARLNEVKDVARKARERRVEKVRGGHVVVETRGLRPQQAARIITKESQKGAPPPSSSWGEGAPRSPAAAPARLPRAKVGRPRKVPAEEDVDDLEWRKEEARRMLAEIRARKKRGVVAEGDMSGTSERTRRKEARDRTKQQIEEERWRRKRKFIEEERMRQKVYAKKHAPKGTGTGVATTDTAIENRVARGSNDANFAAVENADDTSTNGKEERIDEEEVHQERKGVGAEAEAGGEGRAAAGTTAVHDGTGEAHGEIISLEAFRKKWNIPAGVSISAETRQSVSRICVPNKKPRKRRTQAEMAAARGEFNDDGTPKRRPYTMHKKRGPRGPYKKSDKPRKRHVCPSDKGIIDERWMAKYNELKAIAEEEGSADIPRTIKGDGSKRHRLLYDWIKGQRKLYRNLIQTGDDLVESGSGGGRYAGARDGEEGDSINTDGRISLQAAEERYAALQRKTGAISPAKIALLEALPGWLWNKRNPNHWQDMFDELVRYKAAHGTCVVKLSYDENGRPCGLYTWVHRQRAMYDLYRKCNNSDRKGTKASEQINPERIRLLNGLGFVWKLKDDLWNRMFDELVAYRAKYGTVHVPKRYITPGSKGARLGLWCQSMRKLYKDTKEGKREAEGSYLSPERINLLDSFGFPWVMESSRFVSKKAVGAGDDEESEVVAVSARDAQVDDEFGGGEEGHEEQGSYDEGAEEDEGEDNESVDDNKEESDVDVVAYPDDVVESGGEEGRMEKEGWSKYLVRAGYH